MSAPVLPVLGRDQWIACRDRLREKRTLSERYADGVMRDVFGPCPAPAAPVFERVMTASRFFRLECTAKDGAAYLRVDDHYSKLSTADLNALGNACFMAADFLVSS